MHTVFVKHALLAGLLAASLGTFASGWAPVAPAVTAFADTGTAASDAAQPGSAAVGTDAGGAPTAGTPAPATAAAGTAASGGSAGDTAGVSGGAAPQPSPLGRTLATWFGPGFYGHTTACGQRLTPTLVGVASRTLPCGTLVRIGYHGRHLTVPVLDRGPYADNGAVWDLTNGAAQALSFKDTGRIAAQVVGHVANTPTLGEPAPGTAVEPAASPPAAAAAMAGGASAG